MNQNQKRLLMALSVVALAGAGVCGYLLFTGGNRTEDAAAGRSAQKMKPVFEAPNPGQTENKTGQAGIKNNDQNKAAKSGVPANFKPSPNDEFRETWLDSLVNNEGNGLNVELSKAAALPTDSSGDFYVRSRYQVNASGPLTDIFKFVYRLQKPDEFCFVPAISVVPKKAEADDSGTVEVQLQIHKLWANAEGTALTPGQREFLKSVANVERYPIELLHHMMAPLYAESSRVRLTSVNVNRDLSETGDKISIAVTGESDASNIQPIAVYVTRIKQTSELKEFKWESPPISQGPGGAPTFTLTGNLKPTGE